MFVKDFGAEFWHYISGVIPEAEPRSGADRPLCAQIAPRKHGASVKDGLAAMQHEALR